MKPGSGIGASMLLAVLLLGTPAQAEGVFAGLDLSMGVIAGSSSTTNGGAAIGGGGTVYDVGFDRGFGIGGHIGYRFDPAFSVSLSYEHLRASAAWKASYVAVPAHDSAFKGTAASDLLLGNVGYTHALTGTTTIELRGGLGIAINTLSDVVETHVPTGMFLADVQSGTKISPAARIGIGISQAITPNIRLALGTSATYIGSFATGSTRSGNLGVHPIRPYELDHVWGVSVEASLRVDF